MSGKGKVIALVAGIAVLALIAGLIGWKAWQQRADVIHVTAQFDRPGMRERVLRDVCEIYRGDVYFGEDLMEIPFLPATASKLD